MRNRDTNQRETDVQIAFILTMPSAPSWNGKWSGDDRLHCVIRSFRGAKQGAKAAEILAKSPYFYRWEDGWCAKIEAREVDAREAAKLRKQSKGFAGYEWMVDTIISYGQPLASHQLAEQREDAT